MEKPAATFARASRLAVLAVTLSACRDAPHDPASHGSAAIRLKPLSAPLAPPTLRRTVYVPVYSSIYFAQHQPPGTVELTATVSVRNVSPTERLVLNAVRYYDSHGAHIRDYLASPGELAPMASVEFVVARADTAGGPGANFLVDWEGAMAMDEPMVEAIMTGQIGNAGLSFTSIGRALKEPVANVR